MVGFLVAASSLRFFQRHPAQLGLSLLGILLGVAIVTAVLITNASSQRAFELSATVITGAATHQITGSEYGVDQAIYVALRKKYPYTMTPIIEGFLTIDDELFTVLGLDPFADLNFGRGLTSVDSQLLLDLIISPDALLVNKRSQQRLGLLLDTPYDAEVNGKTTSLRLLGPYASENPAATEGLLIGDIATVQSLLVRGNTLDRIDLVLDQQQASLLAKQLPPGVELQGSATRTTTMQDMTRGFQINLTAMSLLALLVGAFLIHNTMTFSILQRRELFATLRITGVTSRGIFASILAEVFVISLIGSVLGVAVGYALAHYLIQLTTQTINDLYFVLHVQQIWFGPRLGFAIILLGVVTSMVAAGASATEAAMISPVQARMRSKVESRAHRLLPLLAAAGLATMFTGAALAWLPGQSLLIGFAALMLLIVGYGLAIPWAVSALLSALGRVCRQAGFVVQMAIGGIQRSISRTGLAIAALTIAVSATFGVDVMIGSFRHTVDVWLGKTLLSDIYIALPGTVSERVEGNLDPSLYSSVKSLAGVRDIATSRVVRMNTSVGKITMLVLDPHHRSQQGFDLSITEGITGSSNNTDTIWNQFLQTDSVLISEPLSTRHRLTAGDMINILTSTEGYRKFRIAGVYFDYGSSHGRITIARTTYNKYWRDRGYSSLAINLTNDADPVALYEQIRAQTRQSSTSLLIRSNHEIRERSLTIFDRTFQVTRVLRLLTVGVAFVGVFSALLALQLEKAREFAVLRASGATRDQVGAIIISQTVLMGLLAGLLALPLGWMMSEVLVRVINVRSFGWTMESLLPAGTLQSTLLLAVLSAVLAGLYPAWKLSRENISRQLRDE